jgi:predicted alpha/beta superfamily hydrolase
MTTEIARPFVLSLHDAACRRLEGVERHTVTFEGAAHDVFVALPVSYGKKKSQHYPLVIVSDARAMAGSVIEMSRLMAQTREIRESIVVGIESTIDQLGGLPGLAHFLQQALLPWCRRSYRKQIGSAVLFGRGLESVTQAMPIPVRVLHADAPVSSFLHGMRDLFATGHQYGREVLPLRTSWVTATLSAVRPLISLLWPERREMPDPQNAHLIHSDVLDRDFEVFVSLPASWSTGNLRKYPALFVLDANIEYSTVAEAAARMAALGETRELVVIGIGAPRSEGALRFGFRRFEEFAPPAEGYAFDDDLGRFFRSFFAIRGQDARARMGHAPQFLAFLTRELLPRLQKKLPIDMDDLGILGHSAGGTFVGYALCQENSPFRRYVGVSPGIAISGSWLLREGRSIARRAESVWLSIGGDEKRNTFNQIAGIPDTEAFAARVRQGTKADVNYACFDGETHSSIFPRAVTQALSGIYDRAVVAKLARS